MPTNLALGGERRPRAGGEVLQAGADGDDDIGLGGECVRRRATGDADRAGVQRMGRQHARLARHRLDDGDVVDLGEAGELGLGAGVVDPSPGDDQRAGGVADDVGGAAQLLDVGTRSGDLVHRWLEEALREVERLGLDVLRQGDERRPAVRRVEHRGHRVRQRVHDLLGPGDAVPVAGDRLERVVDGDRRITEVLDLLQHRVGDPALERVAGQQQHGQPVGVGHAGRGDHVERAGTDRRRGDHDLAPPGRLGEPDRGQRHPLLVLTAPRRQRVAGLLERLTEAGDVAVTEDREDAGEQRHVAAVDDGPLGDQVTDDGLRRREPHAFISPSRNATSSHRPDSQLRRMASCTLT